MHVSAGDQRVPRVLRGRRGAVSRTRGARVRARPGTGRPGGCVTAPMSPRWSQPRSQLGCGGAGPEHAAPRERVLGIRLGSGRDGGQTFGGELAARRRRRVGSCVRDASARTGPVPRGGRRSGIARSSRVQPEQGATGSARGVRVAVSAGGCTAVSRVFAPPLAFPTAGRGLFGRQIAVQRVRLRRAAPGRGPGGATENRSYPRLRGTYRRGIG